MLPAAVSGDHPPEVAAARFAWEEGVRRLREPGRHDPARARVVDAVQRELRRRVGTDFALADLARVYADSASWYLDLAAQAAPGSPEAWDPQVALDGAFGLYMRRARDVRDLG
jgi:hypothetical protein